MNRIDDGLMGPKLSTNLTIDRQTPKSDFGDRINAGLQAAGGVLSSGAEMATGMFGGKGIISAAVSSLGTFSQGATAAPYSSSLAPAYSSNLSPVTSVGVPGTGINTTVGNPVGTGVGPAPGGTIPGTGSIPTTLAGNPGGSTVAQFNGEMAGMFAEQRKLLGVQIAMQKENQVFTCVSNILKVRHETAKNAVSNIR